MRHSNNEECETGEASWCVRHACHSGQPARSAPLVHRCNQRRRFALEPRRSFLSDAVQVVVALIEFRGDTRRNFHSSLDEMPCFARSSRR